MHSGSKLKLKLKIFFFGSLIIGLAFSCGKERKGKIDSLIPPNESQGPPIVNSASIEGFANKVSYYPGDSVYISASCATEKLLSLSLFRLGKENEEIMRVNGIKAKRQDYFKFSYSFGCEWDTTYRFKLDENLRSGLYSAVIKNSLGNTDYISFVVKEPRDFKSAKLLVIANTNTWQAYNNWGGASFYRYQLNDLGGDIRHSVIVSFRRPNKTDHPNGNKGHLLNAELHLLRWLEENEIDYAMASDADIHGSPYQLEGRKALILQAHPEYYSYEMWQNVFDFNLEGGNLLYLGANGIYWKVGLSDDGQIECRKDGDSHRFAEGSGGLWKDKGLSPALIVGTHYSGTGYGTYHPYQVLDDSHWIYEGTGLKNGDLFGEESLNGGGASGHETDKITRNTPSAFVHLAKGSNPDDGGADLVFRESSPRGLVFSVGSISYTGSLAVDSAVHKITMNVLEKSLAD